MEPGNSNAVEAIRSFNRFYTNIIGALNRRVLDSPFSLTEARILLEISHHGGCNARTIKEVLNVDEGYLSRTIDRLVREGLVAKKRSRSDRRVLELSLSAKGEKTFAQLSRDSGAAIGGMLRHLSSEEISEVVAHMQRIQVLLSRTNNGDENSA
jgi:DNA-binding MarR family transcriptional regulator